MSQEKSLIFKNDELMVKINGDGTTKTTIGNKVLTNLPIQAGDNTCTRDQTTITCASVVSGLDGQVGEHLVSNGGLGGSISVDLDHELVILEDQALLLAHDAEFTVNKVTGQQISAVGLF